MAKIELTADASKAKKAIDEVDKRLKKLDKDSKKPIRPTVEPRVRGGNGRRGGGAGGGGGALPGGGVIPIAPGNVVKAGGSFISQVGGALGLRAAGAMGGALGAVGNIAAGASIGGAVGALTAAAVQLASSVGEFKGTIDGWKKAAENALDPHTEMRNRTRYKDSLADRARTNGATMAEQFATEEARNNVFGEIGASMFNKMGQAIEAAFAGDQKATDALLRLGVNGQMLEGRSLLEQQDIIVQALSNALDEIDRKYANDPQARARAEAELMTTAREIVGAKNMMQVRTFTGGYADYAGQKAFFIDQYQRQNPGASDNRMLEAARQAEIQETLAKIAQNTEVNPTLSGYAVDKGFKAVKEAAKANQGLALRANVTNGARDYNRDIQASATFQSSLQSIDRNTARNNELMERLLHKEPKQKTSRDGDTTATYS